LIYSSNKLEKKVVFLFDDEITGSVYLFFDLFKGELEMNLFQSNLRPVIEEKQNQMNFLYEKIDNLEVAFYENLKIRSN